MSKVFRPANYPKFRYNLIYARTPFNYHDSMHREYLCSWLLQLSCRDFCVFILFLSDFRKRKISSKLDSLVDLRKRRNTLIIAIEKNERYITEKLSSLQLSLCS